MPTSVRSILVATDLTEASETVVRAACGIAAARGAVLHLLHAFDIPAGGESVYGTSAPGFAGRVENAEAALSAQIARVVPPRVTVASRCVEIYVAHRAIAERAGAVGADLIVVGAHSHRRRGDDLLGSTADRVIRSAEVPCLVIRTPLELPLRRVLAPVDRSSSATAALRTAMGWSLTLSPPGREAAVPELTVLHVLPGGLDIPEFAPKQEDVAEQLHVEIEAARAEVDGAVSLRISEEVRWADSAVDEIVRTAGEEKSGLIVIGTHGQGILKRFLIGSVASGVARRAPCPVLLVPPSVWDEPA